jgi:hypothetical protein
MKRSLLITPFLLLLLSFRIDSSDITGTWQVTLPGDIVGTIRYRKDSTFETFVNRKAFTSGKYTFTGDTLTITEESGCRKSDGSYVIGVYKITFLKPETIQFEVIQDSCNGRRQGSNHLKLSKVEKGISQ